MTVHELNEILRRDLGSNVYGEPHFKWCYSEDLFWPAYKTGNLTRRKIRVPLLGSDESAEVETDIPEPEYKRDRMSHSLSKQWVVCKWIAPENLAWWQSEFPGADWPYRGYYFATNASLPQGQLPTSEDTDELIRCVKKQRELTFAGTLARMEADRERGEKAQQSELDSMIRNEFTAFMNPYPGKRGGFVSPQTGFGESPATKKEEQRAG